MLNFELFLCLGLFHCYGREVLQFQFSFLELLWRALVLACMFMICFCPGSSRLSQCQTTTTHLFPHVVPSPSRRRTIFLLPLCSKVREAVTMLDLDVIFYPTPANGDLWRPKAIEMGGKKQFPYMVDPKTGEQKRKGLTNRHCVSRRA